MLEYIVPALEHLFNLENFIWINLGGIYWFNLCGNSRTYSNPVYYPVPAVYIQNDCNSGDDVFTWYLLCRWLWRQRVCHLN